MPEDGKKGPGPQEENKTLKAEVKSLKEELETTKKGEDEKNKTRSEMEQKLENMETVSFNLKDWPQRCALEVAVAIL